MVSIKCTSPESGHFCHAPMVSTLQRFHCGFLKDTLSSNKDTSAHYQFLSSKFCKYRNWGGEAELYPKQTYLGRGGDARKWTRANNGEGVKTWESWANVLFESPPVSRVKNKWGSNTYYYITTLSLFHFLRNSQHPEKRNVSFKNFFTKCECISCCLTISSNLQFQF